MNIIAILIMSCVFGGCVARHNPEPDTEWIMSQYKGQNESVVDARRIREGW